MTIKELEKYLIKTINILENHIETVKKYNSIQAYCDIATCQCYISVYKDILKVIKL